ncbi:phosphoadenylyl-sulfate reductase [Salinibacter ruber]|uniref:phosphoadenylyl-sulfate reductase n=1 Tax=Salinibacter ruber TaxID=146919 RepID=UPI002074648F|nr:phosphoadenylyl-sulfate reductase [Salinibacter ruber]
MEEGRASNITKEARKLEGASVETVLQWTWNTFGDDAAATSSFQSQSVPLLHLISQHVPDLPILFLDTGFHFPETLEFRDQLIEEFGLNVRSPEPRLGHDGFREKYGKLHQRDPNMCCYLNKVEPLEDAMKEYDAWVSGIRRDQTKNRAGTPVLQREEDGTLKVCPMVEWTSRDVWTYIDEHDLPKHPLLEEGYLSIGCAPCTQAPGEGDGERGGRWSGSDKTECGLHTDFGENSENDTEAANSEHDDT